MDWERKEHEEKLRQLEAQIEASTDPAERQDLQRQVRSARMDFARKTFRQRLRDIFLPW